MGKVAEIKKRLGVADGYGAGPLHLLAVISSFALAGYAFLRISHVPAPVNTVLWLAGAIVAHDLIAFPLYSLLGLIAYGAMRPREGAAPGGRPSALNYVRIPAYLSGIAFVVWFPLILGRSEKIYQRASGLSTSAYAGRWLLLTGALFAISALAYAWRLRQSRRTAAAAAG